MARGKAAENEKQSRAREIPGNKKEKEKAVKTKTATRVVPGGT